MVVMTLTTALIFALVVFPCLCTIAPLSSPDVGSLRALASGRFRAFCGFRDARSLQYARVGARESGEMLPEASEVTGGQGTAVVCVSLETGGGSPQEPGSRGVQPGSLEPGAPAELPES